MLVPVNNTSQEVEVPDSTVLLVVKNFSDHMEPVGTAFTIAPYILVTAAHVLEEARSIGRPPMAIQFLPGRCVGLPILWGHTRFQGIYKTELDLGLGIIIPQEEVFSCMLDLKEPSIGDPVATLGFPDTQYSYDGVENIINFTRTVSTGQIIDYYPVKRDSVFCPFPCYAATMQIPGGAEWGTGFWGFGWGNWRECQ